MSAADGLLRDELERLVPAPIGIAPDWGDACRRAGLVRGRRRRTRAVVAGAFAAALAAVVVFATPLGAALGLGGFEAWLHGEPGTPASPSEQKAFDERNERSWAKFPAGTALRRLIRTEAAGGTFTLFGWRSGDALCLRLEVSGIAGDPAESCAPLEALQRASAPVLVVATDEGYGQRERPPGAEYWPVQASVTFGIAADGVTGVELEASDGSHPAVVSANAFLAVITDPPLGERVRKAFASTSDGHRIPVAVAEAPFGDSGRPATGGEARGPARVEVQVGPGSIGWLERREARGVSAEDAGVDVGRMFGDLGRVAFARVLQPDEQSFYRVLVGVVGGDGNVCVFLIGRQGGGGGCSAGNFPPGRPFNLGVSLERGGEQYATLSGLASDDVARMELFLANGDVVPVPLKDNAFVIQAPRAQFPVRVVAYDDQGRVIGSEVPPSI